MGLTPEREAPADDDVVGWMFFGFSRPRRWTVAVADFHGALDAFDRVVPEGVKVMKHEPILRRDADAFEMTPGEVVEQEARSSAARPRSAGAR